MQCDFRSVACENIGHEYLPEMHLIVEIEGAMGGRTPASWSEWRAEARIADLQRTLVRPRPFHFVVRPAAKEMP
jgi:hypothetical protein